MKPTQQLYKLSTEKFLKGKQVCNINNDCNAILVQSANAAQARSLSHSPTVKSKKKNDRPLSFPTNFDPPLDTKQDEFIVHKPLVVNKLFSDQKEVWLDIQSYFKSRSTELDDKTKDIKEPKRCSDDKADLQDSRVNARKLFQACDKGDNSITGTNTENNKLVKNQETNTLSIIMNLKGKSNPSMLTVLGQMLGSGSLFSFVSNIGLQNRKTELNQFRCLMTCAPKASLKTCLPVPLPPKALKCSIPVHTKECKIPALQVWEGCDKICMPCCCPAHESCNDEKLPQLNTCKKLEYRIPSYTECKKGKLPSITSKECCYNKFFCADSVGSSFKPLIRTKIRQAWLLGRKTNMDQFKDFSTMPVLRKDDKDCKKMGQLPCLRASEILGASKKKKSNKDCERLCMPCCAPARDPPDCFYPYVKPECKKLRAPRPSYSECKKDTMKSPKPCECLIPRPPPCDKLAKDKGKRGCGGN